MIYQIELTTQEDNLLELLTFNNKLDAIIKYKEITTGLIYKSKLKNNILRLYKGEDADNLQEVTKYTRRY